MFASILSSLVGYVGGATFMRLLKSPIFWAGGGVVAIFLAYNAGTFVGYQRAAAKCNAAAVQAQLDAAKADLEIARKVQEQVAKEMEILDAQADDLEEKVAKYEKELSKRADRCPLTKRDVKRLRNIK